MLLTGFTRGVMDWGNGVISDVTANYQDIIVWSYAPDGQVNWIKTAGGEGYEFSHTISAGTDGSAYLAGVISGSVVFDPITYESIDFIDPFLTRLDLDILSGNPENVLPDEVLIYPNPSTDMVFIHHDGEYSEFRLYNNFGQVVLSGQLSGNRPEISVADLPAGIYLHNLAVKDQVITYTKVVAK